MLEAGDALRLALRYAPIDIESMGEVDGGFIRCIESVIFTLEVLPSQKFIHRTVSEAIVKRFSNNGYLSPDMMELAAKARNRYYVYALVERCSLTAEAIHELAASIVMAYLYQHRLPFNLSHVEEDWSIHHVFQNNADTAFTILKEKGVEDTRSALKNFAVDNHSRLLKKSIYNIVVNTGN